MVHLPHRMSFGVALAMLILVLVVNIVGGSRVWRSRFDVRPPSFSLAQLLYLLFNALAPGIVFILYTLQVKYPTSNAHATLDAAQVLMAYLLQMTGSVIRRRQTTEQWAGFSLGSSFVTVVAAAMSVFF